MKGGSLSVVGTGIQVPGQMTLEAREHIAQADKVFYLVPDPFARQYIRELNDTSEDLFPLYKPGLARIITYRKMVSTILAEVRKGKCVCAAFYGHPGVFAYPSHESVRLARSEGYRAYKVPGISAEDCLIADLGMDPAVGCHSYETTGFLIQPVPIVTSCMLILWQVGIIGDLKFTPTLGESALGLEVLTQKLLGPYPTDHPVTVYEASFSFSHLVAT